jgi:hypothetical protein
MTQAVISRAEIPFRADAQRCVTEFKRLTEPRPTHPRRLCTSSSERSDPAPARESAIYLKIKNPNAAVTRSRDPVRPQQLSARPAVTFP